MLWNEAPRAGADSTAAHLFQKNLLRVIPEATFERKFAHGNKRIRRRPDLVFFVNGLYLAYAELKTAQTSQTAAGHGRKKIAHDCVEAGAALLREAREHCAAQGSPWPGFRHRDLSEKRRWELRQTICLYEKATHIGCIDMGEMMLLPDIDWLLPEIDDALEADDTQALVETLPEKLVASFMHTAEIRVNSGCARPFPPWCSSGTVPPQRGGQRVLPWRWPVHGAGHAASTCHRVAPVRPRP